MFVYVKNKNKTVYYSLTFAIAIGVLVTGWFNLRPSFAQSVTPSIDQISLSASLFNTENRIITNGTYEVRFGIYSVDRSTADPFPSNADAGSRLWEETQTVTVKNGILRTFLGVVTPFPASLNFESGNYYIGMRIGQDSEMVPRKRIGSVPRAINSEFLQGRTVGTGAGNIPFLGAGGKMDIKNLPTGKSGKKLVLSNDARFDNIDDIHQQNTDIGTDSTEFNIGSDTALGSTNFDLTVSSAGTEPTLRYNGTSQAWQFSNDGTNFFDISDGTIELLSSADGAGSTSSRSGMEFSGDDDNELALLQGCADNEVLSWNNTTNVWECASVSGVGGVTGTGTSGYVAYWSGSSSMSAEAQLSTSRGGTGVNGSGAGNGALLIGNGSGFTIAFLTGSTGLTVTNATGAITLSLDVTTTSTTATTSSNSGLEIGSDGLRMLGGCSNDQVLAWITASSAWVCSNKTGGTSDWSSGGSFTYLTDTLDDLVLGSSTVDSGFFFDVSASTLAFEGATANGFETTLAVTDPTADRTITFPNVTGNVITSGNLTDITTVGTITSGTWNGTTIAVANGGTGATALTDLITLTTHTTGNYVATITAGNGISGTVASEGSTPTLAVDLLDSADGIGSTSSNSGLEFQGSASDELTILQGCAEDDVLAWNNTTNVWECASVTGVGGINGSGTANHVAIFSDGDTLTSEAQLAVSRGGTGLASYTIGDILYASGTTTLARLNAVASGNVLISNGAGTAPSWSQITSSHVTADTLDFTEFQDTLDLDAALTLNQSTNAWSQTFTGTTTTGLTYTANSLTTGTAFNVTAASSPTGASSSSNGITFALTQSAATNATTYTGLDFNFTNNPTVAGNTEYVLEIQNQATSNTTDNAVAALLRLDNADTSTSGSTGITDAIVISASGGLATTTAFASNWLNTPNIDLTSAGAISGATGVSSSGTITFSAFSSNGGVLYTNGSGTLAQATAGTSTQVLHGGTSPSFSAVVLTTDVSGNLPLANGGTGASLTDPNADRIFFWDDSAGSTDWLSVSSNLSISGTTLDVDATLQLGSDGTDGVLTIYSEQGATDFTTVFQPGTQTQNVTYTLPNDDGTSGQVLLTNGTGTLSWSSVSGAGGVTGSGTTNYVAYWDSSSSIAAEQYLSLTRGGTGTTLTDPNADRILFWDDSAGALTFLTAASNLSISGTTIDLANSVQLGSDGTDGTFTIYSEQGATDYTTVFQPGTQTQNVTYTLPNDDGGASQVLITNGTGTLSWSTVSGAGAVDGSGAANQAVYWVDTDTLAGEAQLDETRGGTGIGTYTTGDLLYASGTNILAKRAIGTSGQVLVVSGGLPTWSTLGGGGVTDDSLDFVQFEDTLDLDAALVLNQTTNTWSQTFTGTTTTGLTYTASSLTTGSALNLTTTNTATTNTALSAAQFNLTNAQSTLANTNGIVGAAINFTNNPSIAGNTEYAFRIQNQATSNTTDNAVAALLLLDNADTTTSGTTVVTDAIRITDSGGADFTNFLQTDTIDISAAGTITSATWQGNTIDVAYGGTGATSLTNLIALTTHTTGNYVASLADGNGITGGAAGSEGATLTLAIDLLDSADGAGSTSSNSGLEFQGSSTDELAILQGCANNEVLSWNDSTNVWACASVSGVGGVTGTGTSGHVAYWTGTSSLSSEAQLSVSRGGTGIGSYTIGDILYASGSTTLTVLSAVASGNVLISNGAGIAPSWGQITSSHVTVDALDFTEFQDTLDLDAALVLNQTTNTWSQTFTGTTTTGLTYTASSLTTGSALNLTTTNTATTNTALSAAQFNLTNAQSTLANTNGIVGAAINFTNNPSIAGNTEYAFQIQNQATANTTDNAVAALLRLDNADTTTSGTTVVTDAILISDSGGADFTNFLNTDTIDISALGVITGATGITSSGTITFSGFSTNGGLLYTNGSGVLAQTGAGSATTVLHGGTTPSYSGVSLTADVTGTLPLSNGGTNKSFTATAGSVVYSDSDSLEFVAVGTSGQCLVSNGSSAPSWTACTSAASSPFNASAGVITKVTAGDRLSLIYGDAGDTQIEIENTTNAVIPTADVVAMTLTGGTAGIVTDGVDLLFIGGEFGNGTTNTNSGIHIDIDPVNTPTGDETFYAINIDGLSAGTSATETAINIGSNWDNILNSPTLDISGAGVVTGATGITSSGTITFSGISSGAMISSSGTITSEAQLNVARGGTGVNGSSAATGTLLIGNGSGYTLSTLTGGTGVTITNGAGSITIGLDVATTSTTATTSANSGLEIGSDGLRMLGGCSNDQVLAWITASSAWVCSNKTGGTSDWTSTGALTYLTDTVDDLVVGGSTADTGFFFDVSASTLAFEGATANDFETTLAVTDPSADRTITFPNVTGNVITSGNLTDITTVGADALDFTEFQDTLDLDAALVLNQTTNTWSQTFTGTTTTGLTYTASSLTTGSALNLTTTNTATTNTALSAAQFNLTNAQSTLANTNGIVGAAINFTNNPSIAGNTEYAFQIQNQATANTTDNAVAALLRLDNADTTTSGTTVVTDAILISDSGGADFTNFLNTPTLDISALGAITGATGITSSGTITFSGLTANSFLYSGTGGALTTTSAPTNGQLLIGSTGAAPVAAALTGTANEITVTNGAGSITVSIPDDGLDFTEFQDTLDLDAALVLNQTTNTWSQTFTGTTTTGLTYTANSLTSGSAFAIASSATAFTGSLQSITLSGSNAANTGSLLAIDNTGTANTNTSLYIKHYATGTNNLAFRVDDVSGDTTPFVIDGAGQVGIGTTAPATMFELYGTGSADAVQYLTAPDATYDPILKFRTAATPTIQFSLGVDNSDSDKFKIYSGDGLGSGDEFVIDTNGVTTIANLNLGAVNFDTDAGIISWVDMPVTASAAAATVQSYSAQIDGTSLLTVYGESDGAGGTQNLGVGIADSTPDGRLDFDLTITSTTAATQYGGNFTVSDTGIVTTSTDTTYGTSTSVTRTGATGGTINTYGSYTFLSTDNAGAGTSTAYGNYIDTNVAGSANADTVYGMYITTEANAGTAYGLYVDSGTAAGTEYAGIFLNGNVGIGTATPGAKLNVVDDIASDYAAEIFNDGNATTRWGLLVQGGLDDQTLAGPSTLVQFNDGDGGAVGSITFGSSATAYNTTSDVRLKENIQPTSLSINDLMRVQVRDYEFRADRENKITHGFIAQELATVYPAAVTIPQEDNKYWMIDYSKLMPLVIKAVQDQQVTVVSHENAIMSLNLETDQNVSTLAELQAAVDDQLTVVGANLTALAVKDTEHDTQIASVQSEVANLGTLTGQLNLDLTAQVSKTALLEAQVATLTEQVSTLSEFYATFDLGSLIATDSEGNVDLLNGKLKARILETGGLTIEVVDAEAPTIGTAMIIPIVIDADGDGIDDETGSDGKSIEVRTRAMIPMINGSRIFTSFKGNPNAFSWVDKVRDDAGDYVGFKIRLSDPVTEEVRVDWWLIEQKDNIQ